jgi:hypothetical protein
MILSWCEGIRERVERALNEMIVRAQAGVPVPLKPELRRWALFIGTFRVFRNKTGAWAVYRNSESGRGMVNAKAVSEYSENVSFWRVGMGGHCPKSHEQCSHAEQIACALDAQTFFVNLLHKCFRRETHRV